MTAISVIPIERLDLAFVPRPWPFADERRAEIAEHFASAQRDNPALWNGRVLMLRDHRIDGAVFRGSFSAIDYAAFLAWRRWGFADASVRDCFAQGALCATDGAFLLGVMAPSTANAGQIYFPSGTPDLSDAVGASVDLDRSVWREVAEETGLTERDLAADPGWTTVLDGAMIAHIKLMRAREDAERLRQRILGFMEREREPELAGIRIVRGPADLDPAMPGFVRAFLETIWAAGG